MFGLSTALHMLGRFSPAYIAVILIVSSACKRKESKTEGGDGNDTFASTEFDSGGGQSGGGTGDSGSGDSGAPVLTPPVVISIPTTAVVTSANRQLRIEGTCSSGLDVTISGDVKTSEVSNPLSGALYQVCIAGRFLFELTKSSDGVFNLQWEQGLLGVVPMSQPAKLTWTIASIVSITPTSIPAPAPAPAPVLPTSAQNPPVITHPSSATYLSSNRSVSISGTCDGGMDVVIGGAIIAADITAPVSGSASQSCANGTFTFALTKSMDSSYNIRLWQRDPSSQLDSTTVGLAWTLDTTAPKAPVLNSPSQTPYYDGSSSVSLLGTCEIGAEVQLSGADNMAALCTTGSFSFTTTKVSDGTFSFTLRQTDQAGNQSAAINFQWVRSSAVISPPTIQYPAVNPYFTQNTSLTLSGSCMSGLQVTLGGAIVATEVTSPTNSLSRICSSGAYSFTVQKVGSGVYDMHVVQTDTASNQSSAATSLSWIVDNLAPLSPTIVSPVGGVKTSGDNSLLVSGHCEPAATVAWTGSGAGTTRCSDAGDFSLIMSQIADGAYTVSIMQTDRAGNQSGAVAVQWQRDTSMLATPVITNPVTSESWASVTSFTITGSCTSGMSVVLGGDVVASDVTSPANLLVQTCVSAVFSYTVTKSSDRSYAFQITQSDPTGNQQDSAPGLLSWTLDRQAPAVVTIVSPTQNPFSNGGPTLAVTGTCEANAGVYTEGAASLTASCLNGTFALTLTQSSTGTYVYTFKQKDQAQNVSSGVSFTWQVDTTLPSTPTITSPSLSTVLSSASSQAVAGGCTPGLMVALSGQAAAGDLISPPGSLSQTCSASGSYSFIIAKSVDGTYSFDVVQERSGVYSSAASVSWTRDTQAPNTSVSLVSADPNLSATATIAFSSEAGTTSQCSLDGAAFQTCVSPVAFSNLSVGLRNVSVKSIDAAGNVGAPSSVSWSQASYNTIALYHFNSSGTLGLDSSNYPGVEHNNALTGSAILPAITASGYFSSGAIFSSGSSQYLQAPDNSSQDLLASKMTIEAFVKLTSTSTPASGANIILVSKNGGTAGNYGWRFGLKRVNSSGKFAISFAASLAGTTAVPTEKVSTSFSPNTSTWYHVAVTWDAGNVKFYLNGASKGSATIGTSGLAKINATSAPLLIGADGIAPYSYFNGTVDQLRLSQIVRWSTTFTVPTNPYVAD